MKKIYDMEIDDTKPANEIHDINHGISFGMFYIDDKSGFGFEVIKKEVLKREAGFKSAQEARKAAFEASKKLIKELDKQE